MRNIILNHRNTALCNQCWWAFCVILDIRDKEPFSGPLFSFTSTLTVQIRRPRQAQIQCCCTVTDEISVSELVNVNEPLTRNTCTWNSPMVPMTAVFTLSVHTMGYSAKKCVDTAMRASFGQRWNQSIVQPEIRPGNFKDRLRNFSPTCRNS